MNKLILTMCMALLLTVSLPTAVADDAEPLRRLLEDLIDKERVAPVLVEHVMFPLVRSSTFGKVELDQTTREIVFTAPDRGKCRPRLYRNEIWERMGFSIVHTERRYPYQSGVMYKLFLTHEEQFRAIYFREYDGRVSKKELF